MRSPFSRTFSDLLREQAEHYGDAIAVICADRQVTFVDLLTRSDRISAQLHRRGVGRGDRVGMIISNRLEWLEIFFGANAIGATVVPFSTWSTRHELEFLIADSEIRILFAMACFGDREFEMDLAEMWPEARSRKGAEALPRLQEIIILGSPSTGRFTSYSAFLAGHAAPVELAPGEGPSATDDVLIHYTSGSSARPKAVPQKHFATLENGFNIGERQGLRPGDRVLLSPPLFWAYGSGNALPAAFTHGAALVLQEKFEANGAIELIERHRCTAIYTLPGMNNAILRHPEFSKQRVASLRTGLTIGAPQDFLDAVEGLGISQLCNIYGSTETYGNCCVTWHHWPLERRANCQGLPLPGNEIRIVDAETGKPVAQGVQGLVEVKGYITSGYCGASAEHNAQAFTADGFFRTGDIGSLDADGAFVFAGRNTEMFKKAGINISPAEIEEILLRHPAVAQVGVTGVPDKEREAIAVAFVVPAKGANVSVADLLGHCRGMASKYKVPDRIEFCDALPFTTTGKLQRRVLNERAVSLIAPKQK